MTGYLQRLVTTAVQGQVRVHPTVRPARTGRGAEEPATWTELAADAEPRHAGHPASSAETPDPDRLAPGSDTLAPPAGRSRGLPDTVPAAPPASSPVPAPELITPLFGTTPASHPATPVPAAGADSVARPPVPHRHVPGQTSDDVSHAAHVRDAPAEPAGSGVQPARALPGPATHLPVRREPQHLAGRAASERTGGADRGDIEIHIGRVEVTAVTAPPAVPAAKAARKSINLGDYLRNGR